MKILSYGKVVIEFGEITVTDFNVQVEKEGEGFKDLEILAIKWAREQLKEE